MERIVSIVGPAASQGLTTVAAVRAELGAAGTGVTDAVLARLIADASAAIRTFCGRVLAQESLVETIRRTGRRQPEILALSRAPVVSIASIVEDGVVLAADQWEHDADRGFVYRLAGDARTWWAGARMVVTYVAGWTLPGAAAPTLPADIQRACHIIVASWVHALDRDTMLRSESVDGVGAQSWLDPRAKDGGLPPQAAGLLEQFGRGGLL
jgi:hypothetical protein